MQNKSDTSIIQEHADLGLNAALLKEMRRLGIDVELSVERIRKANAGMYDNVPRIKARSLPHIDEESIITLSTSRMVLSLKTAQERINALPLPQDLDLKAYGTVNGAYIHFDGPQLDALGLQLAPLVAYGALNGGSASSYLDRKKNAEAYGPLMDLYTRYFDYCEASYMGRPKGLTPAFFHPDGSPGYSFMELTLRALILRSLRYRAAGGQAPVSGVHPFFQMTSNLTHEAIIAALNSLAESPVLRDLVRESGYDVTRIFSEQQPLLAAMSEKRPFTIFSSAGAKPDTPLAMPGGHGHNFYALKNVYRQLYEEGCRFVYLGNIDNSGRLISDREVAMLALSGKQGGFEFSHKTQADVKGGVLVVDQNGHLNCGDLGIAVSRKKVQKYLKKEHTILFNTASGLFNLEWLLENIDIIIEKLPMRIVLQDKAAGTYHQTEQVTWEILGMMDNKLIFSVDKYQRFIAAKMVIEMLMASRIEDVSLDDAAYPGEFAEIAVKLQQGLASLLAGPYGLYLENGRWLPQSLSSLGL